jgi:hypothetical protein
MKVCPKCQLPLAAFVVAAEAGRTKLTFMEWAAQFRDLRNGMMLGAVGIILAICSVYRYIFCGDLTYTTHPHYFHLWVLGLWIVVPPAWFAIEGLYLSDLLDKRVARKQDLLAKVWAGVVGLLTGLAAYKR